MRIHAGCTMLVIVWSTRVVWPQNVSPEPRLDRFQLLQYRAADGSIQQAHSPQQWQDRRQQILRGMQQVMGTLPGDQQRTPLNMTVLEEFDAGAYVRQRIEYQSEPENRTPAYLCLPKDVLAGDRKAPAVLCLHPTDNQHGHGVVVGLGGREGRAYAAELAERGYVTLSPSYPHLADYWPNLDKLGYSSGTMKAIWDNMRGLDLLESLPQVDASRGFAAIGHSLGGHNAIFTAVFDARIQAVVSSCGFDSFLDYYDGEQRNWFFGRGWCQIRYMPRLSDYRANLDAIPFDFSELLAALAPRTVYINAPLRDDNFRWHSVDRCVAAARPVYAQHRADAHLIVRHPDADHSFPAEQRREAYGMIDTVLRPDDEGTIDKSR